MTANQVQIRRDSAGNLDAAVPANGELAYDTTNKALRLGDGSTTGGIKVPNAPILQGQTYLSADASGTNTITMTVTPAPAAYVKYQRFVFKAAATNTGAATININSLGAKTIKKRTSTGVADVAAADIQQDGVYAVVYDGTYMQLEDAPSAAAGGGDFELISTATASSSATIDIALPSGYSSFVLVANNVIPATDNRSMRLRVSDDGGSTFEASVSGYNTYLEFINDNGVAMTEIFLTTTFIGIAGLTSAFNTGIGSAAGEGVSFQMGILTGGTKSHAITFSGSFIGTSAQDYSFVGHGKCKTTTAALTDVRLLFHSGNIASGDFYLYGRKDS